MCTKHRRMTLPQTAWKVDEKTTWKEPLRVWPHVNHWKYIMMKYGESEEGR